MKFLDWASDGVPAAIWLVICALAVSILSVHACRKHPVLWRLIPLAVVSRLAIFCFIAFWLMPFYAAQNKADNYGYHHDALKIARLIRAGDWGQIPWHPGAGAVAVITAILYAPFGGDIYGMLFFSAALGLSASLCFCRALALHAGVRQLELYCQLVFLLPSAGMWMSTFGKDSWVALGLSWIAYGYAASIKSGKASAAWRLLAGGAIVVSIRPHIAFAAILAVACAHVWGSTGGVRVGGLKALRFAVLLLCVLGYVAAAARGFIGLREVSVAEGDQYAQGLASRNRIGGSAQAVSGSVVDAPRGIVRVLFEPLPWEAHNLNALLAALENVIVGWLLLGCIARVGSAGAALRHGYSLFCFLFTVELLLMFSILPNVGLISRQRAQLLPFLFVFIAVMRRQAVIVHRRPLRRGATQIRPAPAAIGRWFA